jgi:hypothetical protein
MPLKNESKDEINKSSLSEKWKKENPNWDMRPWHKAWAEKMEKEVVRTSVVSGIK